MKEDGWTLLRDAGVVVNGLSALATALLAVIDRTELFAEDLRFIANREELAECPDAQKVLLHLAGRIKRRKS